MAPTYSEAWMDMQGGDNLPAKIVDMLTEGVIKTFFAAFGRTDEEWFIKYCDRHGMLLYRCGANIPYPLRRYLDDVCPVSIRNPMLLPRAQLGANGSFLAWNKSSWSGAGIPDGLLNSQISISTPNTEDIILDGSIHGVFKFGSIDNVAWNSESYYVNHDTKHVAWGTLWRQNQGRGDNDVAEIVHVAIDPWSTSGDTFVLKKVEGAQDADFVQSFTPRDVVSRLSPRQQLRQIEQPEKPEEDLHHLRKVECKREGRVHRFDNWELHVRCGQILDLIQDQGKSRVVARNRKGEKGFIHKSFLDFSLIPEEAYDAFKKASEKLFASRALTAFLNLSQFASCSESRCQSQKGDARGVGICHHNLEKVLQGSGTYTREFLREERMKWNPDRLASICHPQNRDELQKKAEKVFVLIGVLMDCLEHPEDVYSRA
ncbi:hypothetical protein CC78DRAFT_584306 [Lojkania enalia]|uniref:Helically-extended SH3 domain-containing protein n=1 Tax=Lojkania enalia TaxID=147567 RepID=A0A9P4N0W2_9PLEO|nr:hypothetical protein CC78DRAFT_584306 [Didymosphaeria enalia]